MASILLQSIVRVVRAASRKYAQQFLGLKNKKIRPKKLLTPVKKASTNVPGSKHLKKSHAQPLS